MQLDYTEKMITQIDMTACNKLAITKMYYLLDN